MNKVRAFFGLPHVRYYKDAGRYGIAARFLWEEVRWSEDVDHFFLYFQHYATGYDTAEQAWNAYSVVKSKRPAWWSSNKSKAV